MPKGIDGFVPPFDDGDGFKQIYAVSDEQLGLSDISDSNLEKIQIDLLNFDDIFKYSKNKLEVIKKFDSFCEATDLAILTGAPSPSDFEVEQSFWTKVKGDGERGIKCVNEFGECYLNYEFSRDSIIRPVLKVSSSLIEKLCKEQKSDDIIKFGYYPQEAVSKKEQINLEMKLRLNLGYNKLIKTKNRYTFDSTKIKFDAFKGVQYIEYAYDDRRYIRVKANNTSYGKEKFELNNGEYYKNNNYVWVQVLPIEWYVDKKTNTLISVNGLLSGIQFCDFNKIYDGKFKTTNMYKYLNNYMLKEMLQSEKIRYKIVDNIEEIKQKEIIEEQLELKNQDNVMTLINEIEYNLVKLKEIDYNLFLNYKEEYDKYIKENITDITPLGYLNGRILAEISAHKERPIDLLKYLRDIKDEYLNNFINNEQRKTSLDLNKIDNIYSKVIEKKNEFSFQDRRDIIKNLALVYLFIVYENRNNITLEELNKSYFSYNIKQIIVWIKYLIENNVIKCDYFLSLETEVNTKVIFDMIRSIKFKDNHKSLVKTR